MHSKADVIYSRNLLIKNVIADDSALGEVGREWKTTAVANIVTGKLDLRHFVWEGTGNVHRNSVMEG